MSRVFPPVPDSRAGTPACDLVLLTILSAGLCARPLVGESFERLQVSFLTALQADAGPTPAGTAVLDSLLLAAAIATLVRFRSWGGWSVWSVAVVLLAVAVVVSSIFAADRPLALLAGSNLVITVLAGAALAALSRQPGARRVVLAAVLATGGATAVKCLAQRWYENEQTRRQWESRYKPELVRQGFDLSDPLLVNFERRMTAGESHGFLGHPNLTGSCLMMWLLLVGGVLIGSRRNGAPHSLHLWVGLGWCALLVGGLWCTGSLGAWVAAAAGAGLLMVVTAARRRLAARPGRLLVALGLAYVGLIAAGWAYGWAKGTLPHASLAFRWQYWTAAREAFWEAPLTGIGRENFAAAYLRHKSPQSPEEVRNPHNLWVGLLVELGPLGLAGGALLCGAVLWRILRAAGSTAAPTFAAANIRARDAIPLGITLLVIQALLSGTPLEEPGVWLVWGQEILLNWTILFGVAIWLVNRTCDRPDLNWGLTTGLIAALIGALMHGLIDFAMLTAGGSAVFAACAGAGAGAGSEPSGTVSRARSRLGAWALPGVIGVAAVAAHLLAVAVPTTRDAIAMARLNSALRAPASIRAQGVRRQADAIAGSNVSAATTRAAAAALLQLSGLSSLSDRERLECLDRARALAELAKSRNERDMLNFAVSGRISEQLAVLHQRLGQHQQAVEACRSAARDWETAVGLYPTDPRTRIRAARAWLAIWQTDGEQEAAEKARTHLEQALWIDDQRPPEEVMRLPAREREAVVEELKALSPVGHMQGAADVPNSSPGRSE